MAGMTDLAIGKIAGRFHAVRGAASRELHNQ